jgi:hypothetical protein
MSSNILPHHLTFSMWNMNIPRIFHDITWNIFKDFILLKWASSPVATPFLEECEDDTHTPQMGTWESRRTPKTLELDCRGQNTSHCGVFYIIGKLWKCKCRKWASMGHLDIRSTSCVQKKGRESNWQFDSWPLRVRNRPDPGVCRGSATHCRNPTLAKCGGEAQHFQSWGLGVLRDSRMFRARQQGPKHLALRCFWCHWKGLEA